LSVYRGETRSLFTGRNGNATYAGEGGPCHDGAGGRV
jgi:hypothetical protein